MADTPINALPRATSVGLNNLIAMSQGGPVRAGTVQQILGANNITASRLLVSGANGIPTAGALTSTQANALPRWIKVTISNTDFHTAGTVKSVEALSLPSRGCIHAAFFKWTESFDGPAIATYEIAIGVAGSEDKYTSFFDVMAAVSDTAFGYTATNAVPSVENMGDTTSIVATATSTGANLSVSTQGSIDVWILYSVMP